jgi:hypothetical protein
MYILQDKQINIPVWIFHSMKTSVQTKTSLLLSIIIQMIHNLYKFMWKMKELIVLHSLFTESGIANHPTLKHKKQNHSTDVILKVWNSCFE